MNGRPGQAMRRTPGNALYLLLLGFLIACASQPDLSWETIQQRGVLRVGMEANWVPFEYVDGTGQLTGLDVELAQILGQRLGVAMQFYPNLSFDGLYDALTARQVDVVISAVVVDVSRSADFAYTTPYFCAGQVLVVGPHSADVDEMRDLSGRVLAVQLGAPGDTVARRWARRLAGMRLLHTDLPREALDAVAEGRADAALLDQASALMALGAYERAGLRISGDPITGEQYAAVVLGENRALLRALNAALSEMRRDGTLAELESRWLGP